MGLVRTTYVVVALATIALAGVVALGGRSASAAAEVSGDWSVSYALSCTGTFTQTGGNLTAAVDCGADIAVDLSGSFDDASGTFSLTGEFVGYPVNVSGSISSDGSSLSGTWSAPPIVSEGPFSAARSGGGSATNLTGTWGIVVENIFAGHCSASIEQDRSELTAQVQCESGRADTFTGTFDADAGTFILMGPFSQFASLAMNGTLSADGNSFEGTWFIDPVGPGGVLSGVRVGGGPSEQETPTRARVTATPSISSLPETGSGAGGEGTDGWVYAAIATALALSAASFVVWRRAR